MYQKRKSSIKQWLAYAFAVDNEPDLSEEDFELLHRMADWLVKRNLAEPAIMALETCKPLNFVGAQALVFLKPFVHMVFRKKDEFDRFTRLLEHRKTIQKFIGIIESKLDDDTGKGELGEKNM